MEEKGKEIKLTEGKLAVEARRGNTESIYGEIAL